MPRGDLTQLAVKVFDRNLALAESAEERRNRHVANAGSLRQLLEDLEGNSPLVQDFVDDLLELRRQNSLGIAAGECDRDVASGALNDRAARRVGPYRL